MQSSKSGITASGATAVSVLLKKSDDGKDQTLYVGNVGDSRAILVTSKPINEWVFCVTPPSWEARPPLRLLLSSCLLLLRKLPSPPLKPFSEFARLQIRLAYSLWVLCQKADIWSQSWGRGRGTEDQRGRWIRDKRQASNRNTLFVHRRYFLFSIKLASAMFFVSGQECRMCMDL